MSTIAFGGGLISSRIGNFLYSNGQELQRSYEKLASGKNVMSPSDGVGDYFRSDRYERTSRKYNSVTREVDKATAVINFSEKANQMLWDDLGEMQGIVREYYRAGVSVDDKYKLNLKFEDIKRRITQTQDAAILDGKEVLADSSSTALYVFSNDPTDLSNEYRISFDSDKIVDVSGLDLTAGESTITDALDDEVTHAASYAAQLSGYRYGLLAQRKMAETHQDNSDLSVKNIQDVDDVTELFNMNKKTIQQQAARSFFAQNSMHQGSVLALVASL